MNPNTAQQNANNYMSQAAIGQANYPAFQAQTMQSNINQAGLPQASNQYAMDYNTFSNMFQNDPMGQQYMTSNFNNAGSVGSPTGTPVTSTTPTSVPSNLQGIIPNMPTLNNPTVTSTLPQLTPQNIGSTFGGFTNPVYGAEAQNQNLQNISGVMNAIQGLIGNNWTAVQNASQQTDQTQLAKIQALMNLAGFYQNKANAASGGGGSPSPAQLTQQVAQAIDTDAKKGVTLQALMDKYAGSGPGQAAADVVLQAYNKYNYYDKVNKKTVGYGPAKQSMDDLASQYGVNAKNFGATAAGQKAAATSKGGIAAVKSFGDLVKTYYQNSSQVGQFGFVMPGNNQKQFTSQKNLYLGSVAKQLGLSRSNQRFQQLQSDMPSDFLTTGAEGSFRGHLATLLDISNLRMVVDKSGNTGVISSDDYDPATETVIRPDDNSVPFSEIQNIIGGLQ